MDGIRDLNGVCTSIEEKRKAEVQVAYALETFKRNAGNLCGNGRAFT